MENVFNDENFLLILRTVCTDIQSLDQFCFENGVVPTDPAVEIRRRELIQENNLSNLSTLADLNAAVRSGVIEPSGNGYVARRNELEIFEVKDLL